MTRILVTDDDRAIVSYLESALTVLGYEVVPCRDGKRALAAIQAGHVDLVISDIVMPEMDGLQLLRILRGTDIPVLVMSTDDVSDRTSYLAAALTLGAAAVLQKPFTIDVLAQKIEQILNRPATSSETTMKDALSRSSEAARFRTRALQCRRLAGAARCDVVGEHLIEMAESFERRAAEAE